MTLDANKGKVISSFGKDLFYMPHGRPREDFKYYFADFVRKGGEGVPPKSVTYFLDQNQVFFEQKTPFLALFEDKFSGENPERGGGVPPKSVTPFLPGKKSVKGGTPQIRNFFLPKNRCFWAKNTIFRHF